MPKALQQLTIFVSGPTGTESEKSALRVVAEEISRRLEKTHNVTLRVIGWPEDVRPGIGVDVQSEVSRQIGDSFDIYVGLLGPRFGTPTPRAGSGTEDEFEQALSRFQSDSTSIRVLFYFKRDPADPFTIDIDQLQRVRRFREHLADRGVLYRDFSDTGEFTTLVRQHLDALVIDEWKGDAWTAIGHIRSDSGASANQPAAQPPTEDRPSSLTSIGELAQAAESEEQEERGVLDYAAGFHEAAQALVAVMNGIAGVTQRVGDEMRTRTAEADQIGQELQDQKAVGGSRAHQELLGKARGTVDHAAANLDEFVTAICTYVEQYRLHNRALFQNLRHAYAASSELGQRDTTDDRQALANMIPVVRESRDHTITFQSTINGVPALTGRFKRARRRAAAILGELIAEMSFSIEEAQRLLDEMDGEPSSA